jgi:hypothetical protein
MTEPSEHPFWGRWLLIRVDDDAEDGALVGLELDDCQATFRTRYDGQLGAELGTITLNLTGAQTGVVKGWWRDPS